LGALGGGGQQPAATAAVAGAQANAHNH